MPDGSGAGRGLPHGDCKGFATVITVGLGDAGTGVVSEWSGRAGPAGRRGPGADRRAAVRRPGHECEGKIDHGNRLDRPLMGAQPPVAEPTTLDPAGPGRVHPVPADALCAGTSVLDALPADALPADALSAGG